MKTQRMKNKKDILITNMNRALKDMLSMDVSITHLLQLISSSHFPFFAASLCIRDLCDLVSPERPGSSLPLPHGADGGTEVHSRGSECQHPPCRGEGRYMSEAGGLPLHRHLQHQEDQGRHGRDRAQEDPAA